MSLCRCLQVMYNDISNRIIGFCLESNFCIKNNDSSPTWGKKNPVTSLSMSIPNIKADFAISINEILIYFN